MDRMTDEVRQESPWAMTFADDTVICSERLDGWRCEVRETGGQVDI